LGKRLANLLYLTRQLIPGTSTSKFYSWRLENDHPYFFIQELLIGYCNPTPMLQNCPLLIIFALWFEDPLIR
jgi:hypothetical protein